MKNFILGAGLGVLVTAYLMNRKYNKGAALNQSVDKIKSNIKNFLDSQQIEGDSTMIANDLVTKDIQNGEFSNYSGNLTGNRYVLN